MEARMMITLKEWPTVTKRKIWNHKEKQKVVDNRKRPLVPLENLVP